jgi:hypothetical protein
MGRPPIGKHAMSGAERQARYMERLLGGKATIASVTKQTPADAAKDREIAKLQGEVAKLKTRIAELEAAQQTPAPATDDHTTTAKSPFRGLMSRRALHEWADRLDIPERELGKLEEQIAGRVWLSLLSDHADSAGWIVEMVGTFEAEDFAWALLEAIEKADEEECNTPEAEAQAIAEDNERRQRIRKMHAEGKTLEQIAEEFCDTPARIKHVYLGET